MLRAEVGGSEVRGIWGWEGKGLWALSLDEQLWGVLEQGK